jgi:threonine aldolase
VSRALEQLRNNDAELTALDLSNSATLTVAQALEIAALLERNTHLTELRLASVRLTNQFAGALAKALRVNHTLRFIDLENNKIDSDGIEEIGAALVDNRGLIEITLLKNREPGEKALATLIAAFDHNTTLQRINWRLTSRQSFTLTKKLSRNVEILRRKQAGMDYSDIDPLRGGGGSGTASPAVPHKTTPAAAKTTATATTTTTTDDKPKRVNSTTAATDEKAADVRVDELTSGGVKSKMSRFVEKAEESAKPVTSKSVQVEAKASSTIEKFNNLGADDVSPRKSRASLASSGRAVATENDRPDAVSDLDVKDKKKKFEKAADEALLSPRKAKSGIDAIVSPRKKKHGETGAAGADPHDADVKDKRKIFEATSPRGDKVPSSKDVGVAGDVKAKLEKFKSAVDDAASDKPKRGRSSTSSTAPTGVAPSAPVGAGATAGAGGPARLCRTHPATQTADAMAAAAAAVGADLYGVGEDLNAFEAEVATLLRKPQAKFFISGIMAQNSAVSVACETRADRKLLALHPRSHLLIHEQDAVPHVLRMEPLLVGESARALTFADVRDACAALPRLPAVLIVELPQREIGGQLPTLDDVRKISRWAKENDVHLHCDGARLWQCEAAYDVPLHTVAALFDSVYVSFYKDLGSPCAGAMLIGSAEFIARAAVWQRRFGGSIYTQFPLPGAAAVAFRTRRAALAKSAQHAKLVAGAVDDCKALRGFLSVNPRSPPANMFHIEFADGTDAAALTRARDAVLRSHQVECFASLRAFGPQPRPLHIEVNIGTNNGTYAPSVFVNALTALRDAYAAETAASAAKNGEDAPATKSAAVASPAKAVAAAADDESESSEVAGEAASGDSKLAFSFQTDFRKQRTEVGESEAAKKAAASSKADKANEEAAKKKEEDDAAAAKKKKKKDEEAAKKKDDEAAAAKKKEEEAADAKKKKDDEAAKKKEDEAAAKKKEDDAKKKKDEEAAKKKEDEAAAKKKEDDAKKKKDEEAAASKKKKEEDEAAAAEAKKKEAEEAAAAAKKEEEAAAAAKKKKEEEEAAAAKKRADIAAAEASAAAELAAAKKLEEEAAKAAEEAAKAAAVVADIKAADVTKSPRPSTDVSDVLSPREIDMSDVGDVSPTTRRRIERERRREQREAEQKAFERELEEQRAQRAKEREERRKALGL